MKSKRPYKRSYSSRQEAAKLVGPYFLGFALATFIWCIWLYGYIQNIQVVDGNFCVSVLVLIIIIVEIPIIAITIYLAYKNRIVKMRPKSSYDMGNINDFLIEVKKYRAGNYKYESIKTEQDIIDSHAKGKMIIFTAKPTVEKSIIWSVIFATIFCLILISIIFFIDVKDLEFTILALSILYPLIFGFGIILALPNIIKKIRLKRSFFILSPRGIIYRRKWGDVRAYSWKELKLEIYQVESTLRVVFISAKFPKSVQFDIILPNGAELKFKPSEYTYKEFFPADKLLQQVRNNPNISKSYKDVFALHTRYALLNLITKCFKLYFDFGKLDEQELPKAYELVKKDIDLNR